MDPKLGQLINNKYRLESLIGDGGMGTVYAARHELLGTTVALKFLHASLSRRKGLVERFLQEAKVSAQISSRNVVSVTDVDQTPEGQAYMVMEFVEGKTLQQIYEDLYEAGERLSYGDAFEYMLQMIDGVAAAHRKGIVHRDLKPDNVMICRDDEGLPLVKILDFGIAKLKASGEVDRGLTRPGVVMGTPEYMPPEQAFSADKVDSRADLFSLGVMFFEMLAGRRPVGGDNAHTIAAQYLKGELPELCSLKPTLDADLGKAVHRAMKPDPEDRFETIDAFREAIIDFAPEGAALRPRRSSAVGHTPPEKTPASTRPAKDASGSGGVAKTVPPDSDVSLDDQAEVSEQPESAEQVSPAGPTEEDPLGPADEAFEADQKAAGGTMVDSQFTPPAGAIAATPSPPPAGLAPRGHADPIPAIPALPGQGVATPQRKGTSTLGIVLIALIMSAAAVTGAYYYDQYQQQIAADEEDDEPVIDVTTPSANAKQDSPASAPSAPSDIPTAEPSPTAAPGASAPKPATTNKPTPGPGKPNPPPRPTSPTPPPSPSGKPTAPPTAPPKPTGPFPPGIPTVLPSALPPGFPTSLPTTIPPIPGMPGIPGFTPPPKPKSTPPGGAKPAPPAAKPKPKKPATPGFPSIPLP